MMTKVLIGDMFQSQAKTLVNTVNCVGVMGKGIAQEFKKRYPDMFADYDQRCAMGKVEPGVPYYLLGTSIVNFPTKKHWRSASRLQDVVKGLDIFLEKYKEWGVTSIAFPPLGCGNGGLEWATVGPVMYQKLSTLNISVEIFAPFGTPKQQLTTDFLSQAIEVEAFIKGKQQYANSVGRTIFQKICYIMTEQGVETGFHFSPGSYGPFSNEVKEALNVFSNMNLISEQQLGKMNALRVGPEYQNVLKKFEKELEPLQKKIVKTVDLFSRVKNTEQAEEITTVLFAARQIKKVKTADQVTEQDLYEYIVNWKKEWKKEEKQKAIASTIRNLEMLDWLKLKYSESLPVGEY